VAKEIKIEKGQKDKPLTNEKKKFWLFFFLPILFYLLHFFEQKAVP